MFMILFFAALILLATKAASEMPDPIFMPFDTGLKNGIINACSLYTFERPVLNVKDPINIRASLQAISFRGIDDREQTFTLVAELDLGWKHPCSIWINATGYSDVLQFTERASLCWHPTVNILNAANDVGYLETMADKTRLIFYPDGTVWWPILTTFSTFCELSLKNFPFDKQNCPIIFETFYDTRLEQLYIPSPPTRPLAIDLKTFVSQVAVWSISGINASLEIAEYENYPNLTYTQVHFNFYFARQPHIYVINQIIPCFCLVVLNLFSVVIPPRSVDRPIYCVTVVLAYTVLQSSLADSIPQSSEVPHVVTFLLSNMLAGVFCTLYALVTCQISRWKQLKENVQFRFRNRVILSLSVIRCLDVLVYSFVIALTSTVVGTLFTMMFKK